MTILTTQADSVRPTAAPAIHGWQAEMRDAVRDPDELCRLLHLGDSHLPAARRAAADFPLFVPRRYLAKIPVGDIAHPLLRQILPISDELVDDPRYTRDPVGHAASRRASAMLQKYAHRALLIVTGACAVHCRYCFRRHYPYDEAPRSLASWEPALTAIAADSTINEVILSGGDPLVVVDSVLSRLVERIAAIPHVVRLRVHSRTPIVLPSRVDDALQSWLTGTRLSPVLVVHANHPAELDDDVAAALDRLSCAGVLLLNQAVLLRGVNDNEATLAALSERLLALRVVPYYLHQLDRVIGAAHFEVDPARGRVLIERLRAQLPGYAVPRYVQEIAGEPSKTWLV